MHFLQFLGKKKPTKAKEEKRSQTANKYEDNRLNTESHELYERPR
jgi:hypothetical protein